MRKDILILVLFLVFEGCSINPKYEKQINKILDWEANSGCFSEEQFDKVFEIIESAPETFEYDFSDTNYLNVVDSNDGKVRAYIVESHGFGGNPSWGFDTRTLIQYRIGNNVYTYQMPDSYSIIEKIAKVDEDQYLVIAFYGTIAQGEHNNHQARVYRFDEKGVCQNHRAFEKNNHLDDEIEVYWEGKISSGTDSDRMDIACSDEDDYENDLYFGISYNNFDGILYVANTKITEVDYGVLEALDGTFRRYRWDGLRFRDITIMEPFEVKNKDYYIRIEQNKDGSCTYKCWNGGVKSGKPNLTINGGTRELGYELGFMNYDEWISRDEYQSLCERYTFTNNGYVYQYMAGWYKGHMYEDLEVYNPKGTPIYSKKFKIISQNEYE